jgi:D-glycero-alpha-D-manno-heptose 1-phosphate guanylyltransferase
VIEHLLSQGVNRFIFSLGYKHEIVEHYLHDQFPSLSFVCCVEEEPLGTGGAIALSLQKAKEQSVLVTNGDTLFKATVADLVNMHNSMNADCTLALKPMQEFDRYGVVEIDKTSRVKSFKEKQFYETGLINGGLYLLNKEKFLQEEMQEKFSFEKDYLEKYYQNRTMVGVVQDEYFIDIGIPEDYSRAQVELQ